MHRPVVFKCQAQQAVLARFTQGRKCAALGQKDDIAWRISQLAFAVEETSAGTARADGKIQIVGIGSKNRSAALGPSEVTDISENAVRMEPPFDMEMRRSVRGTERQTKVGFMSHPQPPRHRSNLGSILKRRTIISL
ncbi:MAG: hypothetical protein WBL20_06680 [Sphingobium sp.]